MSSLRSLYKWKIAILKVPFMYFNYIGFLRTYYNRVSGFWRRHSVLVLQVCVLCWDLDILSRYICGISCCRYLVCLYWVGVPVCGCHCLIWIPVKCDSCGVPSREQFFRSVGVTKECRWTRQTSWVPAKCEGCGVPDRDWFWVSAKCGSCGSLVESSSVGLWEVTKEWRWVRRNGWKGQQRIRGTMVHTMSSSPKDMEEGPLASPSQRFPYQKDFYKAST